MWDFPYNRDTFREIDFLPCSVTDRACPELTCDKTSLSESKPSTSEDNPEICNTPPQVYETENTPPEEIRGFPKTEERKLTGNKRRKGRSMIPTDTPEKKRIWGKI